jgi:hypothetical protein
MAGLMVARAIRSTAGWAALTGYRFMQGLAPDITNPLLFGCESLH